MISTNKFRDVIWTRRIFFRVLRYTTKRKKQMEMKKERERETDVKAIACL